MAGGLSSHRALFVAAYQKPRIRRAYDHWGMCRGVWCCYWLTGGPIGEGMTPAAAYAVWLDRVCPP